MTTARTSSMELIDPLIAVFFQDEPVELGIEFHGEAGGEVTVAIRDRQKILDTISCLAHSLEVFDNLTDGMPFEEAVERWGLEQITNIPLTMEDFEA